MKPIAQSLLRIFLLIFFTANGYILLSGSVCFWLSNQQDDLSPQQTRLFDTCTSTWTQGTTQIFTLLDNNILKLLQAEKDGKK
ncbi:MAG: hypothetical protein KME15_14520 [Drouetiella hepatica Uher 2000/2452]|jgi:hypothetical protein|uniref:Uncharacterized protein n=1 Tax=Drouetiella hepatica Uher 2000/2452 TaxID=904376 RepID=A0A951UN22_9CYAN|nr:hypothetical protein [Drouetiella hepatica Uher 2000/2452]